MKKFQVAIFIQCTTPHELCERNFMLTFLLLLQLIFFPFVNSSGFFFSHIGWLLCKKHPDVIEKGKGLDISDLLADPVLMFQRK